MKYWYDCEFLENGKTIRMISIGMVDQSGREYYAENRLAPWTEIADHKWLMKNVVPSLSEAAKELLPRAGGRRWKYPTQQTGSAVKDPIVIANDLRDFVGNDPCPEFWAYYAAYDHICLCQLYGRMLDLPKNFPMMTMDIKQKQKMMWREIELPVQESGHHNALADARWHKLAFEFLDNLNPVVEL